MTFTVDWTNRIVDSSASITDVPTAHAALRGLEASSDGAIHPPILTYKELPLGGGAVMPAITFINGYRLRFSTPGAYVVTGGNVSATILTGSGVSVERTQALAYAVTSSGSTGGSGATPEQVAAAVWSADPAPYTDPSTFGGFVRRLLSVILTGGKL